MNARCIASLVMFGAAVVAGFLAITVAAHRADAVADLAGQLPYALSGVFSGSALVGFGLGCLAIQLRRVEEELELDRLSAIVAAVRRR